MDVDSTLGPPRDIDKTYGTIVLNGTMSEAQRAELDGYLVRGTEYRPAILELVGLEMNRVDDEWFDMNLTEMTIEQTDRLGWDGELDEHPQASIEEFIAGFKAAAERQWRLRGTLHVEIDASAERGWRETASALKKVISRVEEQLARGELRELPFTAVTNQDGHAIGRVWVTDQVTRAAPRRTDLRGAACHTLALSLVQRHNRNRHHNGPAREPGPQPKETPL